MTIEEFIAKYKPCIEPERWLRTQPDLQTAWRDAPAEWLIWAATQKDVLTESEQRLFACWCVRQVWHLLTDETSRNAVEFAEKFARGEATHDELDAASAAARYAASAASAAASAASAAASAAAGAAAWDAAWQAQAKYIRDTFYPKTLAVDHEAAMT